MLRATTVLRRAAVKPERVADTLALDHESRNRRHAALTAEGGLAFRLDLEREPRLDDGDAVMLEDGRLVRIRAAAERLIEITTDNPARLTKVAWHIGNRHVPAEIAGDALYIGYDPALLEMVRGLGAKAREVARPFRPERAAHHHDHGHDHHDHDHHGHDHHDHEHHGHEHHGSACGCGGDHHHDHGHSHDHAHGHSHGGHGHKHG